MCVKSDLIQLLKEISFWFLSIGGSTAAFVLVVK
ncbi:hypothetical protein RKD52_004126 [Metabacillus sp. SLBN-84]